jgi:SAP domain-containing protein
MAKIKFDVRDSDPDKAVSAGNFEQPKPGVYKAKLVACDQEFAKDEATGKPDRKRPMLVCKYELTDKRAGKANGAWLWDRVSFSDAAKWKLDQFLQAFGIADKKKRTGELDTDVLVGEACTIRVKGGTYQGEYRGEVGAVLAASDEDDEDDTGDDDDGSSDVLDDTDDLSGDETEDEVESDEGEAEFPYYDMEELAGMQIPGLLQVAEDLEIEPPKAKQKNRVSLSKWIFENQPAEAPEDEEGETAEEPEADADAEDDGYDELTPAELKQECKDRDLDVKGTKAVLIARLREDDAEESF